MGISRNKNKCVRLNMKVCQPLHFRLTEFLPSTLCLWLHLNPSIKPAKSHWLPRKSKGVTRKLKLTWFRVGFTLSKSPWEMGRTVVSSPQVGAFLFTEEFTPGWHPLSLLAAPQHNSVCKLQSEGHFLPFSNSNTSGYISWFWIKFKISNTTGLASD